MQWLIDSIIEAIGIPPVYIYRGSILQPDWNLAALSQNGGTNWLDFSGIVPAKASAVCVELEVQALELTACMCLQLTDPPNTYNRALHIVQVIGIPNYAEKTLVLRDDQKIRCVIGAYNWLATNITVKGWWL